MTSGVSGVRELCWRVIVLIALAAALCGDAQRGLCVELAPLPLVEKRTEEKLDEREIERLVRLSTPCFQRNDDVIFVLKKLGIPNERERVAELFYAITKRTHLDSNWHLMMAQPHDPGYPWERVSPSVREHIKNSHRHPPQPKLTSIEQIALYNTFFNCSSELVAIYKEFRAAYDAFGICSETEGWFHDSRVKLVALVGESAVEDLEAELRMDQARLERVGDPNFFQGGTQLWLWFFGAIHPG